MSENPVYNKELYNVNPKEIIDEFMGGGDISKENSNSSSGPSSLLFSVGGEGLKKDNLRSLREHGFEEVVDLHEEGGIHIHDLSLGLHTPYCAGHSLSNLLATGLETHSIKSGPAKHLKSFVNHVVNYIGTSANDFAGAQAFNNIDIFMSAYAYKRYLDYKVSGCSRNIAFKLTKKDLKQEIQSLLFHLNFDSRWGNQAPFSNISLGITVPENMVDETAMVGGYPIKEYYNELEDGIEIKNHAYGDLQGWVNVVVDTFLYCYLEGDHKGEPFTFPVLTINVTKELFDNPISDKIFELSSKFGTPFYQNFINGVSGGRRISPDDTTSMCCRLSLDLDDIKSHIGGLFGNGDQTGSLQVVDISLPFLAKKCKEEGLDFYKELRRWMELIKEEQIFKRAVINKRFEEGFYQLAKQNFSRGFSTFFTTIGFIGLWECVEIITGDSLSFLTKDGMKKAEEILEFMKDTCFEFKKETGELFNLEATPNESGCYKLANKALKKYPDLPVRGSEGNFYLTNSCHIPVEFQGDISVILRTQNRLQTIPTGGTVSHFTIGEQLTTKQVRELVWAICHSKIPYFSVNTVYQVCPICGYVGVGSDGICPNNHTREQIEWVKKNKPDYIIEEGDEV